MESFWRACAGGDFKAVLKMLRTDNTLATAVDENGMTCLHWAARHFHMGAIKYITAIEGVNLNARTIFGSTAFTELLGDRLDSQLESTAPRIIKAIKLFVGLNKDIVNQCHILNESPLQLAVKFHHIKVVKQLVKLGSDVNHRDSNGASVLHIAAHTMRVDSIFDED